MQKKEILAIIGSRQVGKTTLLNLLYNETNDEKEFISFDDQITLSLFQEDIESFIIKYVKNRKYLFIDEFQYAKEGGKK